MPVKIAFIGAGSLGFTRRLVHDLLCVPELQDSHFALMDISAKNLAMTAGLIERDIKHNGFPAKVSRTTRRREALEGADFIFCIFRHGGLEAFKHDVEIPLRYGVDQCVGDTLCAGGIMYAQRGVPAILEVCKDIKAYAKPGALFMNYANPMAIMTWACNEVGGVRTLGLCHGVQGGHWQIAEALGKKKAEIDILAAGLNHQTWYLQIKDGGRSIGSQELLEAFERHPVFSKTEKVRIDVLRRFGYYSTESNGHLSEYLPWYRKRREEIKRWIDMGDWINGETGGYLRVCTEGRNWFKTDYPNWMKEEPPVISEEGRSEEHGSRIVEGLVTGRTYRGHFNVVNRGVISNLPDDCVVEVPGYVDNNGINIPRVGELPLACAATLSASVSVQRLALRAALSGDGNLLKQAMLHDPLCGAVCNPEEVWQMADRMLVAEAEWLPQYKAEIAAAKKRLKGAKDLGHAPRPAAALKTKTVGQMKRDAAKARRNAQAADKAAR
jgi:alpha-galactosidase